MSVASSFGSRLRPLTANQPPGPRSRYPGQFLVSLAIDKLGLFGAMARHSDVSQIMLGPQRVALLSHPDDIQTMLVSKQKSFVKGRALEVTKVLLGEGLLTSEGEHHLRQRRLIQPAFHRERLASYGNAMTDLAERLQRGWRANERLDVHEQMMRVTLAIAGRTLFDADVDGDAHECGRGARAVDAHVQSRDSSEWECSSSTRRYRGCASCTGRAGAWTRSSID